ncbi:S-adenosyl-L-methionine-dependent methyltransferase [Zopfia rhizophila CBS 207.26]|uniref:S-adenosyl-L-methionine-dependent methyltransferase n=1 Tax=Zopfia rhizophila CBS 207.26 TaxID=1314779 RepID=A0A6A6EJX0_9PEZI|nr:S-adenosyl-L-methionine-dependent methyltransferase [Zopfia rhizophila CBS 207.26]
MTHPTTVDMTFDTSLVDLSPDQSQHQNAYPSALNASFSTTESEPSDAGQPTPSTSTMKTPTLPSAEQSQETPKQSQATTFSLTPDLGSPPKSSTPVQHLPTQDTYDAWASVYDTDGNILQAIDDLELSTLLPEFLTLVLQSATSNPVQDLRIIDLGCGTGRNTAKVLSYEYPKKGPKVQVTALDFSQGMLDVAGKKLGEMSWVRQVEPRISLELQRTDCFPTVSNPSASPIPDVKDPSKVNGVLSTLVLEHIPLKDYFATLASLVERNGYALVTNMHSEMGNISQAGFVNERGVKVRGKSFAHTPMETAEEARGAGFEVLSVKERRMGKSDIETGIVSQRGMKWVGIYVWYGLLLRKVE